MYKCTMRRPCAAAALDLFRLDYRPAAEKTDPSIIAAAGGIDNVLKQMWAVLPAARKRVSTTQPSRCRPHNTTARAAPWLPCRSALASRALSRVRVRVHGLSLTGVDNDECSPTLVESRLGLG